MCVQFRLDVHQRHTNLVVPHQRRLGHLWKGVHIGIPILGCHTKLCDDHRGVRFQCHPVPVNALVAKRRLLRRTQNAAVLRRRDARRDARALPLEE